MKSALIVVDMLNSYEHDDAEQLTQNVEKVVEPLLPPDGADFVLKARHTIFYMTPLEYLLGQKEIDHLVLAGQVTEQCILYSALDAYVRHFDVSIPRDGVAHIHEDLADAALEMMERNMSAEITSCADVRLSAGS